jgi:hypothetical protein
MIQHKKKSSRRSYDEVDKTEKCRPLNTRILQKKKERSWRFYILQLNTYIRERDNY